MSSNALMNVFEFQIAGAERDGFRAALGDESRLDSAETGERNRGAVMGVEAFEFNLALSLCAADSWAATAGVSGKKKSLPSVSTPSTSKRRSLILRARAWAESLGIGGILAAIATGWSKRLGS